MAVEVDEREIRHPGPREAIQHVRDKTSSYVYRLGHGEDAQYVRVGIIYSGAREVMGLVEAADGAWVWERMRDVTE